MRPATSKTFPFDFETSAPALDPSNPADADALREQTQTILDAPQFRHFQRLKGALKRSDAAKAEPPEPKSSGNAASIKIPKWFEGFSVATGFLVQAVAWLAVALVCLLIVYLAIRALQNADLAKNKDTSDEDKRLEGEDDPTHAPGARPADAYVSRARELAAAGRFHEAVAQLLLGALSYIERSELIRYRRGLTHDDYLRAVRSHNNMHQGLTVIVRTYEPLGFGRRQATRRHFDDSLSGYEVGFRATS